MNKFSIYSLTSLAVLISSAAFAEQDAYAPTFVGGVTASIGTWYAVPSANNTDYITVTDPDNGNRTVQNAEADFDFGYQASLGYLFENTANDIELSYRGLNTSDTTSSSVPLNPFTQVTLDADATDKLEYEYNAADLMIGQFLDIGNSVQMRFSGGLSYANIEQTQTVNADVVGETAGPGPDATPGNNGEVKQESEFNGFGPRVAIDARYDFGQGFGIVGGGSAAYLLGDLDVTTSGVADRTATGTAFATSSSTITDDVDNHAVTNLRANLAIDYVYFFDNEASTLGLELGYQVDYYADAIYSYSTNVITSGSVLQANNDLDTSSVTFSGPYVNLKGVF